MSLLQTVQAEHLLNDWTVTTTSHQSFFLSFNLYLDKYPINGVDLTNWLPVPLPCTFTDKEKDAIKTMREQCAKHIKPEHTDWYLSRFLIARKWDMAKATELFNNAMKWREEEVRFLHLAVFSTLHLFVPTFLKSKHNSPIPEN